MRTAEAQTLQFALAVVNKKLLECHPRGGLSLSFSFSLAPSPSGQVQLGWIKGFPVRFGMLFCGDYFNDSVLNT
jgi:hypothetical protein